jgi:hypothetical protein
MDPITIIVTAITTGAILGLKDTTEQIIKDAYVGLKALIIRKYGSKGDVKDALKKVEDKPDSDSRKGMLREELEAAGAASDTELLKAAQDLLAVAKPDIAYGQQTASITGDRNAVTQVSQQAGDHAVQIGVTRDVTLPKP